MHLLSLPNEIRHHIWKHAFTDRHVTLEESFNSYSYTCEPCAARTLNVEWYHDVFKPLLTCKQIWREANEMLHKSMHVYISNYSRLDEIAVPPTRPTPLLGKIRTITIFLHLDEENRDEWCHYLTHLLLACKNLKSLTVHNHMRPPMSYENLMDAIFVAAPLVRADLIERRVIPDLNFDYIYEDIMFTSPFLGEIRCSDALDEHSSVVKDLIKDEEFQTAARDNDMQGMGSRLVLIARGYEQPWFQRLQRRRLEEVERRSREGSAAGSHPASTS